MTLTDFPLSNARRFYSSMGNPLAVKGLRNVHRFIFEQKKEKKNDSLVGLSSFAESFYGQQPFFLCFCLFACLFFCFQTNDVCSTDILLISTFSFSLLKNA